MQPFHLIRSRARSLFQWSIGVCVVSALVGCQPADEATEPDAVHSTASVHQAINTVGYPAVVLSDGPSGYWRLGDTGATAVDASQGIIRHDGTYARTNPAARLPILGQPGAINGDDDTAAHFYIHNVYGVGTVTQYNWVEVPSDGAPNTPGVSVEAWVSMRPGAPPQTYAAPAYKGNGVFDDGYGLYYFNYNMYFYVNTRTWRVGAPFTSAAEYARFRHVVGTYDGTDAKIYIDGVRVNTARIPGANTSSSAPFTIGKGAYLGWGGTLDEVATYGYALSEPRIKAHYEAGKKECTEGTFGGHTYRYCPYFAQWQTARDRCRGAGLDLVKIDGAPENDFVTAFASTTQTKWIGANDLATERTWAWSAGDAQFLQGAAPGTAINGAYDNFPASEPVAAGDALDCASIRPDTSGAWASTSCAEYSNYVCESTDTFIDADCDGVDDKQEARFGLSPTDPADGKADPDGDDVPTGVELQFGGNPRNPDTDGDGILDTTDLLTGTDLDGDGRAYQLDNCPEVANATQTNQDGDLQGDDCDSSPLGGESFGFESVAVLKRAATGNYALKRTGVTSVDRVSGDQKGYMQTGTRFRLFADRTANSTEVTELVNDANRRHAYAISPAEVSTWVSRGYRVLGSLGWVANAAPSFGQSVEIKRFIRGTGASIEQAVTADAAEATELVSGGAGFTPATRLGFGIADFGRLSGSRVVDRLERSDGATLHTAEAAGEESTAGYLSAGPRFSVLTKPNGWTAPLFRLRDAQGREALASDSADVTALRSRGYSTDGILGYLYRPGAGFTSVERTVTLTRVEKTGNLYAHATTTSELATLTQAGFGNPRILGSVVQVLPREVNPTACVGAKKPVARIDAALGPSPAPGVRESAGLLGLISACTISRVLGGQVSSPVETRIKTLIDKLDPESRRKLELRVRETLSLSAAERSALLGRLAGLDPGSCSAPVDYGAVQQGLAQVSGGIFNNGVTTDGVSFALVRAPQCGGVSYAGGDPGTPAAAARAVTVSVKAEPPGCGEEICPAPERVGRADPIVYGALGAATVPPGKAQNWANEHLKAGIPLIGVSIGPCVDQNGNPSCAKALGQMCVAGSCRQYPVIKDQSIPEFSGANFWDGLTPQLKLTRLTDGAGSCTTNCSEPPLNAEISVDPPELNENRSKRCDHSPVSTNSNILSTRDQQEACPNTPPDPCFSSAGVLPNEDRIEKIRLRGTLSVLKTNEFYGVQAINTNGTYFRFGENRPIPAGEGRTIHVCIPPTCNPIPSPIEAACELTQLPSCGAAVGGLWNAPPRSLAACRAQDPFGVDPSVCPETPRLFFSSPKTDQDLPFAVFVQDKDAELFVQTRLTGVICADETTRGSWGDDEIIIAFGSVAPKYLDLDELESNLGVVKMDINAGDVRHPDTVLANAATQLDDPIGADNVITIVEDDDIGFWQVLVVTVTAGLAAGGTALSGGTALAVLAAGGSGAVGSILAVGQIDALNPDSLVGRAGWSASAMDISSRGLLLHDGRFSPGDTIDPAMDPAKLPSFTQQSVDADLVTRVAAKHPYVPDPGNTQLSTCASDLGCTAGNICYFGACVPNTWVDPTKPLNFDPNTDIAGTLEGQVFTGDHSIYFVYLSTSLSGRNVR